MPKGAEFDAGAKARYIQLIRRGRPPRLAAEDIGFTYATVRKHAGLDPDFAEAMVEAGYASIEPVEEVLRDKALEGDMSAIKMVLTNVGEPGRWLDKRVVQQQITGPGGGPIQIAVAAEIRAVLTDPDTRHAAIETLCREVPMLTAEAESA